MTATIKYYVDEDRPVAEICRDEQVKVYFRMAKTEGLVEIVTFIDHGWSKSKVVLPVEMIRQALDHLEVNS